MNSSVNSLRLPLKILLGVLFLLLVIQPLIPRDTGSKGPRALTPRAFTPHPSNSTSSRLLRAGTTALPAEIPKVALLFLARGDLPYEPVWRAFLGAVPSLGRDQAGSPRQLLFSIYTHPAQGYSYPRDSLFYGTEVSNREATEWGQHSLIAAEKKLLFAALEDPLNEHFSLLSESCIPIYPPQVVYAQLSLEEKSRVNGCYDSDCNRCNCYRMHPNMQSESLTLAMWRKSSQWFELTREHAALVTNDTVVEDAFARECWVDSEAMKAGRPSSRFCVSDEHYIPTLLASLGRDNETDCIGRVTNARWDGPYFHPRTHGKDDVVPELFMELREPSEQCPVMEAIASAKKLFKELTVPAELPQEHALRPQAHLVAIRSTENTTVAAQAPALQHNGTEQAELGNKYDLAFLTPYVRLGYECPLFARKFDKSTVDLVSPLVEQFIEAL